jgi:hypothetical protein
VQKYANIKTKILGKLNIEGIIMAESTSLLITVILS